jgi:ectoine hydroxylase-related dioxygenase (phytanoyl-CoA dioxygenase family)
MIVSQATFSKNPNKYIASYKKNGFILIKNVLNKSDFIELNQTIVTILNKFSKKKIIKNNLSDIKINNTLIDLRKKNPKKFANFFDSLQTTTSILKFWTNNKVLNTIKLLTNEKFPCFSATDLLLRVDSPIDEKNKLNWHQDSGYFRQNNKGANGINCWAPLINLKFDMGPLEILSKSHNLGLVEVKKKRSKNYGSLQRTLPKNLTDKFKIFNYEMNIGDILFMNMDLVHRSGSNFSSKFRFSALCRFHKVLKQDFNPGLNIYRYSDKKLNKKVHGF